MKSVSYILFFLFLASVSGSAKGQLADSKPYEELLEALATARAENDHEALSIAYYELAIFEEKQNNNPERSFEMLSRSLEYYKLTQDSIGIVACNFLIAKQLLRNGMHGDAYDLMEELKTYYSGSLDLPSTAKLELLRYRYFFERLEVDSCESILNRLDAYFEEFSDTEIEYDYLYQKVTYYELLKDYKQALTEANTCVERSRLSTDATSQAKCLLGRGKIYLRLDEVSAAISNFKASSELLSEIPYSAERLETYRYLADCYRQQYSTALALEYVTRYAKLQDSILNENRVIAVNNITYKYESKEKETEIILLEKDKELVEKSIGQQKRALVILGLSIFGLLLGMYHVIRFYREKINNSKIIESQNQKINQQKIRELQDELQINSMRSMITGQEVERERIAKDLHDSLGGLLSTIKLRVDNIKGNLSEDRGLSEVTKATDLLDIAVSEVRNISQDLQPGALKRLGLVPSIYDLINRYRGENSPEITFEHFGIPPDLEQNFSLSIFRIIQEILNNAIKHAQATEIFIQLNREGKDIVINIEDDGVGFDPDKKYESMGLENIKSRINILKGSLEIDSRPYEGTSFVIHVSPQPGVNN